METLTSVCIIEKDKNGDVFPVWTYPIIEKKTENILMNLVNNEHYLKEDFFYVKVDNIWNYVNNVTETNNDNITRFSLVLSATDLDVEKYYTLGKMLVAAYLETFDPIKILGPYLSLFGTGKYSTFKSSDFDARKAKISNIKDIVASFKEQSALIWAAMLFKKRIVVYSENLKELQSFIKGLPVFVWSRQQWDMLFPLVNFDNKEQTDELVGFYVAGTSDSNIRNNPKWYDLFVDIPSATLLVAEHAKDDLKVTKVHKDVAREMMAQEDNNQLIKQLAVKTKDILGKLEKFVENGVFSIDKLKGVGLDPDLERFLLNAAISENLVQ